MEVDEPAASADDASAVSPPDARPKKSTGSKTPSKKKKKSGKVTKAKKSGSPTVVSPSDSPEVEFLEDDGDEAVDEEEAAEDESDASEIQPTETLLTLSIKKIFGSNVGVGIGIMELPATHTMPARLLVMNCQNDGRAAKAGVQPFDELRSIDGLDVLSDLGCSKQRVNALFAEPGEELTITVLRKATRDASPEPPTRTRAPAAEAPPGEVAVTVLRS